MDERVPEHRESHASSSHQSSSEPQRQVVSGKHSIYTQFPKDRNCDICQRTKITRTLCRRRTGEEAVTSCRKADHKVLNEAGESRNNHRYAVVVQDLATQQNSILSVQNKNFSGDGKELTKVSRARQTADSRAHKQIIEIWQNLVKVLSWNYRTSTSHRFETMWYC